MAKEKDEYQRVIDQIRLERQMQRKRLYEQAKRGLKKDARRGQKSS